MNKEQIKFRYGSVDPFLGEGPLHWVNGTCEPKNTLATYRRGKLIYFGIARCNFDMEDKFSKQRGKEIATFRLQHSHGESMNKKHVLDLVRKEKTIVIAENGWHGVCHVEQLSFLLEYFYNIDFHWGVTENKQEDM